MKRVFLRIISLSLGLSLLAAGFSGCGPAPEPKPQKTTTGFDSFEITYYWGPQGDSLLTDKWYWEAAAEAGFTSVPLENASTEANKTALGLLRECGLTCSALWDSRILKTLSRSYTDEETEAIVREVVEDYADYLDVIKGWWLRDEPGANEFKKLGRLVSAFRKVDPDRPTFIDLFPTYAKADSQLKADDYQNYVDRYMVETGPQYMSYDHYHFRINNKAKKGFYTNFEIIRKAALDAGIDYMMIDLLSKYGDKNIADVTRTQLLWEVNMCLLYGAKRISHFTYFVNQAMVNEGWNNACVNDRHEKYPHFEDAKVVNTYALPLGRELFNKKSEAVFHLVSDPATLEEGCTAYESYGALGAVTGDDFAISFFSDGCFMIMNRQFLDGETNTIVMNGVTAGLEYFDTATASWKPFETKNADGAYVHTFAAAEALLFRVK